MKPDELVDYAASLDCIHCGLCLRTCPTYQITGSEAASPRGRIYMMRGVAERRTDGAAPEFAEEMDFCLVCRHCESVCPAGVRFGEMMETTRNGLEATAQRPWHVRLARSIGFGRVLPNRRWLGLAATLMRLAQRTGLARLGGTAGRSLAAMPLVPPRSERQPMPARTAATGERRGTCAMLEGCAMPELFGRVNRATARALASIGWESRRPTCDKGDACCGALHAHNGQLDASRELARKTIDAFDELGSELPVVVNSAGCGAHMKEYGRLLADDPQWRERARAFGDRVADFTEFMAREAPADWTPPDAARLGPVTYDDPCHLCHGQGVRTPPRELLDRVPGLERVELPDSESCCGSAGIYSMLRPADSAAVFAAKLEAFDRSGARVLVTANPGCHLQWQAGLAAAGRDARVVHMAELLAPE